MTNLSFVTFHPDDSPPPKHARYVVRVPRNTEEKQLLLRLISAALRFPDYFGSNWDALDECLGDLSWLDPGDIVIWHEAVPLSSQSEELKRYLEVLRAVQLEARSRSLTISFPESARATVEELLT